MNGSEKEELLERVKKPPVEPSKQPDQQSREELLSFTQEVAGLTPTGRQEYHLHLLKQQLEQERDRLLRESQDLRSKLDYLAPRNAELEHARRTTTTNGVIVAILIGVASVLAGIGPACCSETTKWVLISIAIVCLATGLVLLVASALFGWPPAKRAPPKE